VLGVNNKPLIVRCDVDLLRSELAHVEAEAEHLGATWRTVVEHVAEVHLFQQVLAAAAAVTVVRRLQPEEVIAQARHLSTNRSHRLRLFINVSK